MKTATILRSNSYNSYKKVDAVHVIQSGGGPPRTGNSQNIFSIAEQSKGMWVQILFHVCSLLICKNVMKLLCGAPLQTKRQRNNGQKCTKAKH